LNGFLEKTSEKGVKDTNSMYSITSFLLSLTNLDKDAKLHVDNTDVCKIGFLLLNSSVYFQEIVDQARSVVLCGGTMEPQSILIQQLFPKVPKEKIVIFGCGHVIPDRQLLVNCIASGPSFQEFDFTFQARNNVKMIEDVGRYILMMSRVVPDGIVIFFPSYQYEELVLDTLTKNGMLKKIDALKKMFREPKSSVQVGSVFSEYKKTIDDKIGKGAILTCVVGGKMSEGINFSDAYARCVVMVGLPYPNPSDPELVEKMSFLDKMQSGTGQQYYESLCMRAVNQSIGRSIRHFGDYACICLLDKRYQNLNIRSQLPKWIQNRITCHDKFGTSLEEIKTFFETI
jgi:chromosome transmission fidelity protein 1